MADVNNNNTTSTSNVPSTTATPSPISTPARVPLTDIPKVAAMTPVSLSCTPAAALSGNASISDTTAVTHTTTCTQSSSITPLSSSPLSSPPSSPLTSPASHTPSPPPELAHLYLPTPDSSQMPSENGSPCPPDANHAARPARRKAEEEQQADGAPKKKRRISEKKPREMERIDLLAVDERDLAQKPQVNRLLKMLYKKRKIVVVAGAGISVSAGIPDFRSSTGLFKTLKSRHNLKSSGKELFDASVYKDDNSTSNFHTMIRSLSDLTRDASPTPFHHLLATLAAEHRLLRLYSQNVDGIDTSLPPLETQVPLAPKGPWPKTIQLHGSLDQMVCSKCHKLSPLDSSLFDGPVPPSCSTCVEIDDIRTGHAGKRSHGVGRLRPRMVLYNEHNPDDEAIGAVIRADLKSRPDALLVVGTTLKVPGVRRLVKEMCSVVRGRRDGLAVWVNMDEPPREFAECWDLLVQGPCDSVADRANMRKWDDKVVSVTDEEEMESKKRNLMSVIIDNSPVRVGPPETEEAKARTRDMLVDSDQTVSKLVLTGNQPEVHIPKREDSDMPDIPGTGCFALEIPALNAELPPTTTMPTSDSKSALGPTALNTLKKQRKFSNTSKKPHARKSDPNPLPTAKQTKPRAPRKPADPNKPRKKPGPKKGWKLERARLALTAGNTPLNSSAASTPLGPANGNGNTLDASFQVSKPAAAAVNGKFLRKNSSFRLETPSKITASTPGSRPELPRPPIENIISSPLGERHAPLSQRFTLESSPPPEPGESAYAAMDGAELEQASSYAVEEAETKAEAEAKHPDPSSPSQHNHQDPNPTSKTTSFYASIHDVGTRLARTLPSPFSLSFGQAFGGGRPRSGSGDPFVPIPAVETGTGACTMQQQGTSALLGSPAPLPLRRDGEGIGGFGGFGGGGCNGEYGREVGTSGEVLGDVKLEGVEGSPRSVSSVEGRGGDRRLAVGFLLN